MQAPAYVTLKVYDILGREVATLVSDALPAGRHTRTWDAAGVAGGVYVYRLVAGEYREARRMVLVK